jgi:hypothetical protein
VCWGVLYQADVRCRGEHMETLHHAHLHKHNNDITAGLPTTYNSTMPWDAVWAEATKDSDWWKTEFELPAMRIKFERAPPAKVLADTTGTYEPPFQRPSRPANPKAKPQAADLCRDFNKGKCSPTGSSQCGKRPSSTHKCTHCGSHKHGATECPTQVKKGDDSWRGQSARNGKKRRK